VAGARLCPGSVHALPLGLLGAQQAAMVMFCRQGPGPRPQQPPGTPRNPKPTERTLFPYAGPTSLDVVAIEGAPLPKLAPLMPYGPNACLLPPTRAVVPQDGCGKLILACWQR
jgi:hypothetical protein